MIEVKGLAKAYAERPVLHSVDLKVEAGEFLVILGPSGAGKSTLLRCLNGLVRADAGTIMIDGKPVTFGRKHREEERPIAMIFQHHNLVKRLSVLKNVLVGRMAVTSSLMALLQMFRKVDVGIALSCLRQVELEEKANFRADRLSGGEQQRVGIARALAQKPAVMLADEPVASLDPKTSRIVLGYLKGICKELGIAAICNLHQVDYAVEFADRIIGLSGGNIIFDDKPNQLSVDIVHRIYPGLEDPGIARILKHSAPVALLHGGAELQEQVA